MRDLILIEAKQADYTLWCGCIALYRCKKFQTESLKASAVTQKVSEFIVLDDRGLPLPTGILGSKVLSSILQVFFQTGVQFIINSTSVSVSVSVLGLRKPNQIIPSSAHSTEWISEGFS